VIDQITLRYFSAMQPGTQKSNAPIKPGHTDNSRGEGEDFPFSLQTPALFLCF
jgi:hypothetical protein